MEIFELAVAGPYQTLRFAQSDENGDPLRYYLRGEPKADGWVPFVGSLRKELGDSTYLPADVLYLGGSTDLAVNGVAVEELGDWFRSYGELLAQPVDNSEHEWWVFNPLVVLDALDEERSDIQLSNTGRVRMVRDPVFFEDRIGDVELFRLATKPAGATYVTGTGVERLEASGLVLGIDFRLLWDGATVPQSGGFGERRYGTSRDIERMAAAAAEESASGENPAPDDVEASTDGGSDVGGEAVGEAGLAAVSSRLVSVLGEPSGVYTYAVPPAVLVPVNVYPPRGGRQYSVLATSGASLSYTEEPFLGLMGVELVAAVGADWPLDVVGGVQDGPGDSVVFGLKLLSQKVVNEGEVIRVGEVYGSGDYDSPLEVGMGYTAWLFVDASWMGLGPVKGAYPGGDAGFVSAFPIYPMEYDYIAEHGFEAYEQVALEDDPLIFRRPMEAVRGSVIS